MRSVCPFAPQRINLCAGYIVLNKLSKRTIPRFKELPTPQRSKNDCRIFSKDADIEILMRSSAFSQEEIQSPSAGDPPRQACGRQQIGGIVRRQNAPGLRARQAY